MKRPIKWAAELVHVREVSLRGTADLSFWTDRLNPEALLPTEIDGQAQLLVIAADSKFMGVPFRELSFSVLVGRHGAALGKESGYLLQAFSSVRFFALCERTLFSTPFRYGDVRVRTAVPASILLSQNGTILFRAEMCIDPAGTDRRLANVGDDAWDGPIFLPGKPGQRILDRKLFFARIRGRTQTYPFRPATDSVTITPAGGSDVFQLLMDSRFTATEWAIREDATHAKSKTYHVSEVLD